MKGFIKGCSLAVAALLISVSTLQAQQTVERCGQPAYVKYLEANFPGYLEAAQKTFEQAKQRGAESRAAGRMEVYTIPVVVHIVHVTGSPEQNLSDDIVNDQIRILNEDYRRMNPDASNLRSDFDNIVGDPMIEFRLAEVIRVETSNRIQPNLVSLWDDIKSTGAGGSDAVDPSTHLNIWVGELWSPFGALFQILGYAYPPAGLPNWPDGASAPTPGQDGVVIDYRAFGSNNPTSSFYENQGISIEGRTTVHEVGHYLGLRHVWGDNDPFNPMDGCTLDDGVDDTPAASESSQASGCQANRNTCNAGMAGDLPDMWENYMDYSQETCQVAFTEGQIDVMRGVLEGPREDLPEVESCNTPSTGTISGPTEVLEETSESYEIPATANTIEWTVTGGAIASGQGTNQITVDWGTGSNGEVCVTESDGSCVGNTVCEDVTFAVINGVAEVAAEKGLSIYPNPASAFVRVQSNEAPESVELINLLGAMIDVFDQPGSDSEIRLSDYSENILFIKVNYADGFAIERIIVE